MAESTIKNNSISTTILSSSTTGITVYGQAVKDAYSVRVYLVARSSSDIATNSVIATLPSGYRPKSIIAMYGYFYTSFGTSAAFYGAIATDGKITQALGNSIREVFMVGEFPLE